MLKAGDPHRCQFLSMLNGRCTYKASEAACWSTSQLRASVAEEPRTSTDYLCLTDKQKRTKARKSQAGYPTSAVPGPTLALPLCMENMACPRRPFPSQSTASCFLNKRSHWRSKTPVTRRLFICPRMEWKPPKSKRKLLGGLLRMSYVKAGPGWAMWVVPWNEGPAEPHTSNSSLKRGFTGVDKAEAGNSICAGCSGSEEIKKGNETRMSQNFPELPFVTAKPSPTGCKRRPHLK